MVIPRSWAAASRAVTCHSGNRIGSSITSNSAEATKLDNVPIPEVGQPASVGMGHASGMGKSNDMSNSANPVPILRNIRNRLWTHENRYLFPARDWESHKSLAKPARQTG